MTKKWKVEYVDDAYFTSIGGVQTTHHGFYKILFEDCYYGMFGKDALENKSTGEILGMIEHMLNDAHDMALKHHD